MHNTAKKNPVSLLPHLSIGSDDPEFSVLWLHGLGANGHDFKGIIPQLNIPDSTQVRFILPHAPEQAITLYGGTTMTAWFDLIDPATANARQDGQGIHRAMDYIHAFIDTEIALGVAAEKIFLAGFSQGGVIALHTGLRYPKKLAGIIALSTYLGVPNTLKDELSDANKNIPIYMAHGINDPVIPISIGRISHKIIEEAGVNVKWREYDMQHEVILDEIAEISKWINHKITDLH